MLKSARGGINFPASPLSLALLSLSLTPIFGSSAASAQAPLPPAASPKDQAHALENSFEHVADIVGPATVLITVNMQAEPDSSESGGDLPAFFGENQQRSPRIIGKAYGSGVIIRPDGYILTNDHVVEPGRGSKVLVTLSDKSTYWGTVVRDSASDLAVVKITVGHPLPYVSLGAASSSRVGQWAIAIGSPLNEQNIVTAGIVSAIHRNQSIGGDGDGTQRYYADLIETDAPINFGSSGGPLLNIDGDLIGINVAMVASRGRAGSGLGFAIPVNVAKAISDQLIATGHVRRSTLGISPSAIPGYMRQKLGTEKGAYVKQVILNSPADRAGIEPGDVVTQIGASAIEDESSLRFAVNMATPRTTLPITFLRRGHLQTVSATLEDRGDENDVSGLPVETVAKPMAKLRASDLGLTVRGLPVTYSSFRDIHPAVQGVLVAYVAMGSVAADANVEPNSVITSVNGNPVTSIASFDAALATLKSNDILSVGIFQPKTRDSSGYRGVINIEVP